MTATDLELLNEFAREHSQDAFAALVNRHLGLVYSAALRQVRSTHLAEEIAQNVFTSLARNAPKLASDTILTAWLYRSTRNAAIDVIRAEARRQAREQLSAQMSAIDDSPADWSHIEPLLDEAMDSLDEKDRTAILLRFFENKSLQEVGAALGTSDDAAQKRVSRAVDQLREFFSKRKVAVAGTALVAFLSANAVQATPAALVTTVAAAAVFASSAISTTATAAVTKTVAIAMTTTQKIVVAVLLAGAVAAGVFQGIQASHLRDQVQTLQQQQQQNQQQVDAIKHERDAATAKIAQLSEENATLKQHPTDVLKLRNQVGQLKRENTEMGSKSALSKVTANPEARKMMRDQQKLGMAMLYGDFIKQAKLAPDVKEKFKDMLADSVMDNVDQITTALRDKPAQDQLDQTFAAQNAALRQKVGDLLGQDAVAQFDDYNKNLASTLTAEQFKDELSGTKDEQEAKSQQLLQLMKTTTASALAAANLPADYQVVPILNFANIASEQEGDQSIKLLQNIYQQVSAQAASFLSPEEQKKFQEFTTTAINNNKMGLGLNRTMMAPIAQ
ncbi:MAG TPA: sigma-70 family RNA polymerase sigma factor [Candidatus Cybelea sp.]|jgi:RNA polymerase sigma factor (sigma-70 family)|nr:sigma-70 family RNA polymerase sigma factor [Candidatus Cybelea sp.]